MDRPLYYCWTSQNTEYSTYISFLFLQGFYLSCRRKNDTWSSKKSVAQTGVILYQMSFARHSCSISSPIARALKQDLVYCQDMAWGVLSSLIRRFIQSHNRIYWVRWKVSISQNVSQPSFEIQLVWALWGFFFPFFSLRKGVVCVFFASKFQ